MVWVCVVPVYGGQAKGRRKIDATVQSDPIPYMVISESLSAKETTNKKTRKNEKENNSIQ